MPTIDNWRALREALEAMCKIVSMHDGSWTSRVGDVNEWGTLCYEIDCDDKGISEIATAYGPTTSAYIAAANPATIRALLAELDRLREALHDERALDAAVAAERERWRELVEQLIACHDEPSCPAVALAREWLGRPNAAITGAGTASGA